MRITDVHTHGLHGYDTRTTDVEHLLKIAEIQGAQGVSAVVLTLYPGAIRVMRESMALVNRAMQKQEASGSQKPAEAAPESTTPARILGVHLEGPFLNPAKCGALNALTFINPSEGSLLQLLEGYEELVKIITVAPELEGAPKLIKSICGKGIIASMGHSEATYQEAEAGARAGARGITHLFNAMSGFHHREPGLAGFGLLDPDIYVEVIADPYHLHPATLEFIFKTKNPDRILLISDTVKESTPFTKGMGVADMHGRLLGGSMSIAESAQRMKELGFNPDAVNACITENPERYLRG
jgi:N-acetylglucosamine-6-phosphate deacetylase